YIFCILFFQNGYTHIITIESDNIPYEYIYHLNVTTNSIECVFYCKICNRSETQFNRYILHPYVMYHNPTISNNTSTECNKDAQCFTNKCVNHTCKFNENNIITRLRYGRKGKFVGDPC
ncbi:hypothetical protein BCR36DRAFT_254448, partial [Piromyces finnis]